MGERIHAFRNAMVEDITEEHTWPDGSVTPAITVFPGKTRDESEPFTRPITRRAWQYAVKPWLNANGWVPGQPGVPLLPGRDGTTPIADLDIGGFWTADPRGKRALALIPFAGEAVTGGRLPEKDGRIVYDWGVPTDQQGWPLMEPKYNPFRGYSAHAYRKTCHQAIGAVYSLLDRHGLIPAHLSHAEKVHFKRAMTTHVLGRSVDDVYDGIEDLGEALCAVIAQPLEDYLWTGSVATVDELQPRRLGADPEAVQAARERVDAAASAFRALTQKISVLRGQRQELREQRRAAATDTEKLTLAEQAEEITDVIEGLVEERAVLQHDWPDTKQTLVDVRAALVVEIPDDVTDEEWSTRVREAAGEIERHAIAPEGPLSDTLNFSRTATLLGVSESRVRQMHAETASGAISRRLRKCLRPGLHHELIWDPTRPRYDRRLLVSAIDLDLLLDSEKELLLALRLEQARADAGVDALAA
jgi:hypothetical protein